MSELTLQRIADQALDSAGLLPCLRKIKEARSCRQGHTNLPAFDVFVRHADSVRGKHFMTLIFFPDITH